MLSHLTAGFIAVLVGYASSVAIIFQAASAAGASTAEVGSWLWALGLGMGISCIALSFMFKAPILTAWSTPGAALLVTALPGVPLNQAVGAFMFSSFLIFLSGVLGWFEKLMKFVPASIAAAMLAGVLLRFGLQVFNILPSSTGLVVTMLITYLVAKHLLARYTIPLTLMSGLLVAWYYGQLHFETIHIALATPILTLPSFSWSVLVGVGIPLFIVTMTSQNMSGLAVLRANGYLTPASPLMTCTGLLGLILAPFGGFAFNLAAITAAICMSKDADPRPQKRYFASMWAGGFYLLTGLFGATMASFFSAFPHALIISIAGLALITTITNSLVVAISQDNEREAAIVTFLATASGLTLGGIGSAFWGIVLGIAIFKLSNIFRSHQKLT